MAQQPNILLIYTDQQRHDTIHALGNDVIQTPNLDRLVREGVAFTQATTPCPVCMPARWSLHCGQWTSTHQCFSNHHEGPRPACSLPATLRQAGYRTGLIGKNHSFLRPDDLDVFMEHPAPLDHAAAQARRDWAQTRGRPLFARLGEEPCAGGVTADPDHAKTDAALQFLAEDDDRPWFLWLSYHHPHTPYWLPQPFFSMYDRTPIPAPVIEPDGLVAAGKPFRQQYHQSNNDRVLPFTADQIMRMGHSYYGMISLTDAEVGRVLGHLDNNGLTEETLVIFTSDHGDYMGDHGLITKSPSLYDCLVRIPFIVRWPGQANAGRQDERFVSPVDILPTLAAAAGTPCPPAAQGRDFLPCLSDGGKGLLFREAAYAEYGVPGEPYSEKRLHDEGLDQKPFMNPSGSPVPWEGNPVSLSGRIRMVRTRDWKYVQEQGGTCELYDLQNDPHELVNLWNQPEHADTQRDMEALLVQTQTQALGSEIGPHPPRHQQPNP